MSEPNDDRSLDADDMRRMRAAGFYRWAEAYEALRAERDVLQDENRLLQEENDANESEIEGYEHDLRAALSRAEKAEAEVARLRGELVKIRDEPQNTMSDAKAVHNMRNLAANALGKHKAALAPVESKGGDDGR